MAQHIGKNSQVHYSINLLAAIFPTAESELKSLFPQNSLRSQTTEFIIATQEHTDCHFLEIWLNVSYEHPLADKRYRWDRSCTEEKLVYIGFDQTAPTCH